MRGRRASRGGGEPKGGASTRLSPRRARERSRHPSTWRLSTWWRGVARRPRADAPQPSSTPSSPSSPSSRPSLQTKARGVLPDLVRRRRRHLRLRWRETSFFHSRQRHPIDRYRPVVQFCQRCQRSLWPPVCAKSHVFEFSRGDREALRRARDSRHARPRCRRRRLTRGKLHDPRTTHVSARTSPRARPSVPGGAREPPRSWTSIFRAS